MKLECLTDKTPPFIVSFANSLEIIKRFWPADLFAYTFAAFWDSSSISSCWSRLLPNEVFTSSSCPLSSSFCSLNCCFCLAVVHVVRLTAKRQQVKARASRSLLRLFPDRLLSLLLRRTRKQTGSHY